MNREQEAVHLHQRHTSLSGKKHFPPDHSGEVEARATKADVLNQVDGDEKEGVGIGGAQRNLCLGSKNAEIQRMMSSGRVARVTVMEGSRKGRCRKSQYLVTVN
jgi:hypothetical protein